MRVSDYVLNQNFVENLHEFEGRLFDIVSDLRDLRKMARRVIDEEVCECSSDACNCAIVAMREMLRVDVEVKNEGK